MTGHLVPLRLAASDAGELLTLQRAAWVQEAIVNDTLDIPPLHESLADVLDQLGDGDWTIWGLRDGGRLIGTARTRLLEPPSAYLGRLAMVPDWQGRGLGSALLRHAEDALPASVQIVELITGARSVGNHAFYAAHGYASAGAGEAPGTLRMVKQLPRR